MESKKISNQQYSQNEENTAICFSDTDEIREAIRNDRPIPLKRDQFNLIEALTKLMLEGKI